MGVAYVAGFDISDSDFYFEIGTSGETTIVIRGSGSGGSHTYYLDDYDANASDYYCHVDIHDMETHNGDTPLSSTWADDSLASLIQQALNAGISGEGWAGSFTVTFSVTTCKYTITYSEANTSLVMGNAETCLILGYSAGVHSGSASHTSDNTCKYAVLSSLDNISNVSDEYEAQEVGSLAISDGGTPFGMARSVPIISLDWKQPYNTHEITHTRKAVSTTLWTFQDLFEHCRTVYPLVACTEDLYTSYYPVCYLREDGANFRPERAIPDYDGYWHIPFRTFFYGWVGA